MSVKRRAIFLDRDGTLNVDVGFAHRPDQLELIPGTVEGLRLLAERGYLLLIATNQSGIARGYFDEAQMHAFNAALLSRLNRSEVAIAGVYFCPFHPEEGVGEYRRDSSHRKPGPGMLLQAADEHTLDLSQSFVIGDKLSDVQAGQNAGCRTVLVLSGRERADPTQLAIPPDYVATDLFAAARRISALP